MVSLHCDFRTKLLFYSCKASFLMRKLYVSSHQKGCAAEAQGYDVISKKKLEGEGRYVERRIVNQSPDNVDDYPNYHYPY